MTQQKPRPHKRPGTTATKVSPRLLKEIFTRNAYIRVPNMLLRKELGQGYKKGYEVRFAVKTEADVEVLKGLLEKAGFSPAKPFRKAQHLILPVYGKQAVACFLRFHPGRSEA